MTKLSQWLLFTFLDILSIDCNLIHLSLFPANKIRNVSQPRTTLPQPHPEHLLQQINPHLLESLPLSAP